MTSVKVKLVFYFVLLAVLPLAVLSWDFARAQSLSERRLVDSRLQVDVRSALSAYRLELDGAAAMAARVGRSQELGRALADGNSRAVAAFARRRHVVVTDSRGRRFGRIPHRAAGRTVKLVANGRRLGSVEAFVLLDARFARQLAHAAGVGTGDRLSFADASARRPFTHAVVTDNAGARLRTLSAPLPGTPNTRLLVATPQRAVEAATSAAWRRLLAAMLVALLFISGVAYFEGRRAVRSIQSVVSAANAIANGRLHERAVVRGRDELATLGQAFNDMAEQLDARLAELKAERARLREVISGFGAALAATHDDQELLRVIVATVVEATAATGGKFISVDGALVECGHADGEDRFELPVAAGQTYFGRLVLSGRRFSSDDEDTAASLAAHAAVALENARLHGLVAQQALTDGLTGLANRRQCGQALAAETARAVRYGSEFSVVLADVDRFKRLNDTHGHAAGDAVLRQFADILRAAVRDSDVACRWGGEEFLLLLPGTDLDGAVQLAERIRRQLQGTTILSPEGVPLSVTASFGVAAYSAGDEDADVVVAADESLYAAKRGGRNRVVARQAVATSSETVTSS